MNKESPSISVTQLGKYFSSTRKVKENILKARKNPKANKFLCNRYNSVKAAVIRYMLDEKHDPVIFEKARQKILERSVNSEWKINDKKNSIEAINILEKNLDKFFKPFIKFQSRRCSLPEKSVKLFLVEVGLNPEIILFDKISKKIIGAIKLVFTKNNNLSKQSGEIVTILVRDHLIKIHKEDIINNNCIVIDVFSKKIYCSPDGATYRYYKRVLKNTCLEIVQIWDKI